MKKKKNSTKRLALLGILTAILIIQNFVPFLGNIPIPPLNPTIIHVTVIVATLVMGTKDGMLVGGIWGVIRMIKAYTMPTSPLDLLLWLNPIIAVVPRVLIGLTTGLIYRLLQNKFGNDRIKMAIASVVGSLTNTIFVLLFIYLIYGQEYASALDVDLSNLSTILIGVVATNGVAEAITAAILVPLIVKPIKKIK
ncbi:ECF transporter S component [Lacticigenium naphthae]|uniref:ECF transporter S component n=1 Tax=Lacticigenium naphthae TaxID=515351 RepID=UPI00041DC493|nr:ECF transporter S component [Lacticigenium naphthae]